MFLALKILEFMEIIDLKNCHVLKMLLQSQWDLNKCTSKCVGLVPLLGYHDGICAERAVNEKSDTQITYWQNAYT